MNVLHPLEFFPRASFNDAISATDTKGAILIGIASTIIMSFTNSVVSRLLAHKPGQDIAYDKWLRNMIFQTGFSKNLLLWLRGSDGLRESHYKDNRKPVRFSRLILPLMLKMFLTTFSVSLIMLSIPRDTEFRSSHGVGFAAYLGGNGTDLIPFGPTHCLSFPERQGRYERMINPQICYLPTGGTTLEQSVATFLTTIMVPNSSTIYFGAGREKSWTGAFIQLFLTGTEERTQVEIEDISHDSLGKVIRNGLLLAGCKMKDQGFVDVDDSRFWDAEDCQLPLDNIMAASAQAIAGSIHVTTNNTETRVQVFDTPLEDGQFPIGRLTVFEGPIIRGTEPLLGVATLLLIAGLAVLVDVMLSFIKLGESDYLSVVAPLVRDMAGVDCLDNPLQAEQGKMIKFIRAMRGEEGHLGYIWRLGDILVPKFPKGTAVRASAPLPLPRVPYDII